MCSSCPDFSPTASLPVEGVTVEVDTAGTIDVEAERKRLEKDLAAANRLAEQASRKLDNPEFLAKAPKPVVEKVRGQLASAQAEIERLQGRLDRLPAAGR